MTFVTSSEFASIAASGNDWRDVARQILTALEPLRNRPAPFTLGFLYVSDHLAADVSNILDLLRSVTGVQHWVGTVAVGVCGSGVDYIDVPAAAVLLAALPPESFKVFPVTDLTLSGLTEAVEPWLETHDPMLMIVHGDPATDTDPALILAGIEQTCGGFITGGISSSRRDPAVISDIPMSGGIGGVIFSSDIPVATTLTQGCAPLGPARTLTRVEDHVILELDGRSAVEVFTDDLKALALRKAAADAGNAKVTRTIVTDEDGPLDPDIENLFRGEVHIAFPVTGSDTSDYMVRNILGLDPDSGHIAVSQTLEAGQQALFVHRDDQTVRTDLVRAVEALKQRLIRETGGFRPKGGIYISCVARAVSPHWDSGGEMEIIRDILGEIPLAGFYAGGEISNRRLYGYTGVLILFL